MGIEGEADVGVGGEEGFVVEHTAEAGIGGDADLFAACEVAGEVAGNGDDAEGVTSFHLFFCLFHVGTARHDVHLRGGVQRAEIAPTFRRGTVVNDHDGHFLHDLFIIYKGVEQGIAQGHEQTEDDDAAIAKDGSHFVGKDVKKMGHGERKEMKKGGGKVDSARAKRESYFVRR